MAQLYRTAMLRSDTTAINALIASDRHDCPPTASYDFTYGTPGVSNGERLVASVTRDGRTWHAHLTVTDGDTSDSGSDVIVVRNTNRYFVC